MEGFRASGFRVGVGGLGFGVSREQARYKAVQGSRVEDVGCRV